MRVIIEEKQARVDKAYRRLQPELRLQATKLFPRSLTSQARRAPRAPPPSKGKRRASTKQSAPRVDPQRSPRISASRERQRTSPDVRWSSLREAL